MTSVVEKKNVKLNFVVRTTDNEGTIIKSDATGIDESLGTLALLAERIAPMIAQVREQEIARQQAAQLSEQNKHQIFVEGESDKIILERALKVFHPTLFDKISFVTKKSGAGHSFVLDMLSAWRSQHKHHPSKSKAVGIVDGDAIAVKNEFNKQPDNIKSAKCLSYVTPTQLHEPLSAGFKFAVTLETLYPIDIWLSAKDRGHLIERDPAKIYPPATIKSLINREISKDEITAGTWAIFVNHDFAPDAKISEARRICQSSDEDCKIKLLNFKTVLDEALIFLDVHPDVN